MPMGIFGWDFIMTEFYDTMEEKSLGMPGLKVMRLDVDFLIKEGIFGLELFLAESVVCQQIGLKFIQHTMV